jgi:hypothetical protein
VLENSEKQIPNRQLGQHFSLSTIEEHVLSHNPAKGRLAITNGAGDAQFAPTHHT